MSTTVDKKAFMLEEVIPLLKKLPADREASFGLMTPQHMVEHLAYTLKSAIKRVGEVEDPPTKKQLGFQKFIAMGAILQHKPNGKTKADLPELKYGSMGDAIAQVEIAINRFYDHFEAQPDFKCYNAFFGELGFEDVELFNFMHYRYHLWQFGLIDSYPTRD